MFGLRADRNKGIKPMRTTRRLGRKTRPGEGSQRVLEDRIERLEHVVDELQGQLDRATTGLAMSAGAILAAVTDRD